MNSPVKALFILIAAASALFLTGCTSKTNRDTSIPWSRPADWEGQVPGMGDMGSGERR